MFYDQKLSDITLIAFDLETTGGYIYDSEICEFAAVKWHQGEIVDSYQTLIKPTKTMSDFIIGIHGITNEMVASAPPIQDKIVEIHNFLKQGFVVAHHSPFDMGFLGYEFEKAHLEFFDKPALCSSLISREILTESPNHRLQTLVEHLQLPKGTAHRALDDAKACLGVTLKCIEKFGADKNLNDLLKIQKKEILWKNFSIEDLKNNNVGSEIVKALEQKRPLNIVYSTDVKAETTRSILPKGIARGPDGDYVYAFCLRDQKDKRFYLNKIQKATFQN